MKLQVALDLLNLEDAIEIAEKAAKAGAHILEAGTPLIKSEGIKAVRELKNRFPDKLIFADMKIMDTGYLETEMASKAGADIVQVLGSAPDDTIKEAIKAGKDHGVKICCDLIGVEDPIRRAMDLEAMGIDYINLHIGIDQQKKSDYPYPTLKELCEKIRIPIIVAGGINDINVNSIKCFRVDTVIVGGFITKSKDPAEATRIMLSKMV
jgi:3-hexulose-6-phosphate synthase/6-phospho-3-hexuloisomerase